MAPKRRRAPTSPDTSRPTTRVTRSSTKATRQTDANESGDKRKQPSSKSPSHKKHKAVETPVDASQQTSNTTVNSLTITTDELKAPINCQQYHPSDLTTAKRNRALIFTHGAGGTLSTPSIVNFCTGYAQHSSVLVFQGSMNLKSRVKGFHACMAHLRADADRAGTGGIVLGGRSMGARAAVMAALELIDAAPDARPLSLILASYPLKGPNGDLRDKILLDLPSNARVLFIVGDRDDMCPLPLLHKTMEQMPAKAQLIKIKGADHGLHVKPAALESPYGIDAGRMAAAWATDETYQIRNIGE